MPDLLRAHSQRWVDHFAGQGHNVRQLAAGVEGAVYDLSDGRVAKVWRDHRVAELERLQSFYADVAAAGLHFSTPEVVAIERVNGLSVTYERKLPGQPLQRRLAAEDHALDPAAARCVAEILRALATIPATAAMRQLAVLDEDQRPEYVRPACPLHHRGSHRTAGPRSWLPGRGAAHARRQ